MKPPIPKKSDCIPVFFIYQPIITKKPIDWLKKQSALKIYKWWRKRTYIFIIKNIISYLRNRLSMSDLQELVNKCHAINKISGEGSGLTAGCLIDIFISVFFKVKLPDYEEYHNGEADMKICKIELSQKKINGKSIIALDWSKNKNILKKPRFNNPLMIINLKSERWWKKNPKKKVRENVDFTLNIPSGVFLIDNRFCKFFISLTSNNKTDTLITSQYLYLMLKRSMESGCFILLPEPNQTLFFNVLHAFIE